MSIKLSSDSGEALAKMQRALRLAERPPLIRLGLALGLAECGGTIPKQQNSRGPEIPLKVVTSGDDLLMDCLVEEATGLQLEAAERRRVYKAFVDYGLVKLYQKFRESANPGDFLLEMARQSVSS